MNIFDKIVYIFLNLIIYLFDYNLERNDWPIIELIYHKILKIMQNIHLQYKIKLSQCKLFIYYFLCFNLIKSKYINI